MKTLDEWDDVIGNLKARYHYLKNHIASSPIRSGGFYKEIKRTAPPTTERDCPHQQP